MKRFLALLPIAVVFATPALTMALEPNGVSTPPAEVDPVQDPVTRRLLSSMAVLLMSGLLVLIFSIGAYLLIRIGRSVSKKPADTGPTEFVDAWSRYRVSDADVDAAMRGLQADHGVGESRHPDDDDFGDPPIERPPGRK